MKYLPEHDDRTQMIAAPHSPRACLDAPAASEPRGLDQTRRRSPIRRWAMATADDLTAGRRVSVCEDDACLGSVVVVPAEGSSFANETNLLARDLGRCAALVDLAGDEGSGIEALAATL